MKRLVLAATCLALLSAPAFASDANIESLIKESRTADESKNGFHEGWNGTMAQTATVTEYAEHYSPAVMMRTMTDPARRLASPLARAAV